MDTRLVISRVKLILFLLGFVLLVAAVPAKAQQRSTAPTADQENPAPLSVMQKRFFEEFQPDDNRPQAETNFESGTGFRQSLLSEGTVRALGIQPMLVQPNDFSYLKVTGTAFSPRKSTSTHDYTSNGCIFQNGGTDFRFQTSLLLPEGSQLKYVRLYFVDTAATNMTVWLTKYQPGQSNQDIVSVQSAGAGGYGTNLSQLIGGPDPGDPPAETVDNATNAYVLSWGTSVATNANQLCGVRVAYYLPAPGEFNSVSPCRVFDTRAIGPQTTGSPLASPGPYDFRIQGNCGIPNGAKSVALNATVVTPTQRGHIRLYPTGGTTPTVSTLNYPENVTVANGAIVPLAAVVSSTDKDLSVFIGMLVPGTLHLVIDVTGYFY
jgi:hypothetical protein